MTRIATTLLVTASALAFASPAMAASTTLYASDANLARSATEGQRVTQVSGITQIRLTSGGTASFVAGASFQIRADGSVDLFAGTVTIASGEGSPVVIHLADRGEGRVSGRGSAASFSVDAGKDGRNEAKGHVLTGTVTILIGTGSPRQFTAGQMWNADGARAQLAVANGAAAVPGAGESSVAPMGGEGGAPAAAANGVPVVLGDALAAAGASGDVIAAARRVQAASANPSLESYPSGDLALLVAYAGNLNGAYGGRPFNGAAADIIRTYLQFLSTGGSQANFLSAYAGFMVQYLDLIRSGALPSSFRGTNLAQINSFISFRGRTSGFSALSGQNRVLVDAYLAFIQGGGNADQFLARYTDLTTAYFTFIRGGGSPAAFTGASQSTITAYLTFLRDAGLLANLTAQNQALLSAYLTSLSANGNGLAFADTARVNLNLYYVYLQQGRLPSGYTAADLAALRQYLETLKATGLFDQTLGTQASFFNGYLIWLQGGGAADGYAQLPANVFAGYATALSAYYEFLNNGGVPSGYTVLTQEQIRIYLAALEGAGATARFTGNLGTFWAQYYAWIVGGNNPNLFAGLPTPPDYPAFATALNAYYVYLAGGGLPGSYTALTLEQLRTYINALIAAGRLGDLGGNATFLQAYFTYLGNGGVPNGYAQLPVYLNYQTALNAYYTYLQGGGLPSAYTALTPAQLQAYLQALINAGVYSSLFTGNTATFLTAYYNFVSGGGAPNGYTGLPAYTTYTSALNAYFVYLQGGGLPGSYTTLTLAQLQAYLQAMIDAGILGQYFTGSALTFFQGYYTYVAGGGVPNNYTGLATIVTSGTGSSGGGALGTLTTYTGGYAGGTTARVFATQAGSASPGSAAPTIATNGALVSAGDTGNISATAVDIAGDSKAIIGRLSNGEAKFLNSNYTYNANSGLPYVILAPRVGSLPTSGTIDYSVLAATRPVFSDGGTAPGTITANLTLGFGATSNNLTYKTSGTITMPEAGGNVAYNFASTGYGAGTMQPVTSYSVYNSRDTYLFQTTMTGSGRGCVASGCYLQFYGDFAGSTPQDRLGVIYQTYGGSQSAARLQGAVIFAPTVGTPATPAAPTGDGTSWVSVGGIVKTTVTNPTQFSDFLQQGLSENNGAASGVVSAADGKIQSVVLTGGVQISRGTATIVESGTVGGNIGWSRWAGGTATVSTPSGTGNIPQDGGYALASAKPVTNMPVSGTATYTVAGSTTPFRFDGTATPGTLNSASLAVNFGTRLVGLELSATVAGTTYALQTFGGTANPTMALGTSASNLGYFQGNLDAKPSTPSASGVTHGFLAGPAAANAIASYQFNSGTNVGTTIGGVIGFSKAP